MKRWLIESCRCLDARAIIFLHRDLPRILPGPFLSGSFLSGRMLPIPSNLLPSPNRLPYVNTPESSALQRRQPKQSTNTASIPHLIGLPSLHRPLSIMPSTKSQKVAKAANTEDDTRRFFERQRGMNKAVSQTARSSSHVRCPDLRRDPS